MSTVLCTLTHKVRVRRGDHCAGFGRRHDEESASWPEEPVRYRLVLRRNFSCGPPVYDAETTKYLIASTCPENDASTRYYIIANEGSRSGRDSSNAVSSREPEHSVASDLCRPGLKSARMLCGPQARRLLNSSMHADTDEVIDV